LCGKFKIYAVKSASCIYYYQLLVHKFAEKRYIKLSKKNMLEYRTSEYYIALSGVRFHNNY